MHIVTMNTVQTTCTKLKKEKNKKTYVFRVGCKIIIIFEQDGGGKKNVIEK